MDELNFILFIRSTVFSICHYFLLIIIHILNAASKIVFTEGGEK